MSRPWRDGDTVIAPDGLEWDLRLRNTPGWCMVTRYGLVIYDAIENLLASGWRLKEKSDE